MEPRPRRGIELRALLYGAVLGFGINLLTSSPDAWPGPLRYVNDLAAWWVPAVLVTVVAVEVGARRRHFRQVTWTAEVSPYPGLEPYGQDRAAVYFGRETESQDVSDRLSGSGPGAAARCVPIIGPSGSGKSSLVQAGVLPRLSANWTVVGPVRPGADPFLGLAATLAAAGSRSDPVDRSARLLRDEARGPGSPDQSSYLLGLLEAQPGDRILLVIDQAEELVTMTGAEDREAFLRLVASVLERSGRVHLLVAAQPQLLSAVTGTPAEPLFRRPYPIGPLEPRLIREVITRPARAAGLEFEEGLVDIMVAEATVGDALPLLGHLLQRLAERARDTRLITAAMYDEAGRVGGAIAEHAEEAYSALLAVHPPKLVEQTLLRFVSWLVQEPTLVTVAADDLSAVGRRVVDEFKAARLIVEAPDGVTCALAHEAMLRRWQRLADLVTANQVMIQQRTMLEQRALAWSRSGEPTDDLLHGTMLNEALTVIDRFAPSAELRRLVAASVDGRQRTTRDSADRVAARAQSFRSHDKDLAKAVAHAAVTELGPSPAARFTLWGLTSVPAARRLSLGHTGEVTSVVWRSKHRLVSAARDGTICSWDAGGRMESCATLPPGASGDGILSPDGQIVAVIDEDGTITCWSIGRQMPTAVLETGAKHGCWLAWSPTGRYLAVSAYSKLSVHEYDDVAQSLRLVSSVDGQVLGKLRWSPDESMVASFGLSAVVFSADGGHLAMRFAIPSNSMADGCWSPDSTKLALAVSEDQLSFDLFNKHLHLYDTSGGELRRRMNVRTNGAFAWSPEGTELAVATRNRYRSEITLWDVDADRPRRTIEFGSDTASKLRYSPDGDNLAVIGGLGQLVVVLVPAGQIRTCTSGRAREISLSRDGRCGAVRLMMGSVLYAEMDGSPPVIMERDSADSAAIAPDGTMMASSSRTDVTLFDLAGPDKPRRLAARQGPVRDMEWCESAKKLAAVCTEFQGQTLSRVEVWSVGTASSILLRADGVAAGPLAWAPGDELLAGILDDGIAVWDSSTGELTVTLPTVSSRPAAMCWSADGGALAAAYLADNQVLIWSLREQAVSARCVGHFGRVRALAWDRATGYLASLGGDPHDRTLRLWDPASGQCLSVLDLPGAVDPLAMTWHSERRSISVTMADGWVYTWPVPADDGSADAELLAHPVRALTTEERRSAGLQAG